MTKNTFENFSIALKALREKWREVPGTTQDRVYSSQLLPLTDSEFLKFWSELFINNCYGLGYSIRGWYHDLYKPLALLGGNWLDVGSGLGFDGVYFAENGANVTFIDIVEDNLKSIERICKIKGITSVEFLFLNEIDALNLTKNYDVIMAIGSLIHAPYDLILEERKMLAAQLRIGGRWLELCYPKERWEREGKLEFNEWGKKTDGERNPWSEWYDSPKLLRSLQPYNFEIILDLKFHNKNFHWFDLIKRE